MSRSRSRGEGAGAAEEQADAISGAFEALGNQIAELSTQARKLVVGQRIQMGLLLIVMAAIFAPYVAALAGLAG